MRRRRSASRNLQQACVFRKRSGFTFKHISVGVSITASLRFSVQAGKLQLPLRVQTPLTPERDQNLVFHGASGERSTAHVKPESPSLRPHDSGSVAGFPTEVSHAPPTRLGFLR